MMENRSFDHYLGDLSLSEGRTDVDGLTNPLPSNPDLDGKAVSAWCMDGNYGGYGDPPHGYCPQHANYFEQKLPQECTPISNPVGGNNKGFVRSYQRGFPGGTGQQGPEIPMGYYTRKTLPVIYALTDHFTLCDHWFSSILSSTWPNRKYFMSGKRDQDNDTHTLPPLPNGFNTTPFLEVFEKAINPDTGQKCTWKCYFSDLPFLGFWYKFAFEHLSHFHTVLDFVIDCKEGTLPDIAIIDPPFGFADDHPSYDVRRGQKFLGLIVDALTHSRSWQDSAMLLTYDENGGFYDHVPPPSTFADGKPVDGDLPFGFRVPSLLISPYSSKKVSKVVYEHTSLMKSVSMRWNVQFDPKVFNDRWTHAPDFWTDCFDFTATPKPAGVYTKPDQAIRDGIRSAFRDFQWETGTHTLISEPPGGVLEKLERIFALPGLRRLDRRRDVFDILNAMEKEVVGMKRMYRD